MWAAGVVDIGLTSDAFWDLTPREFHALFDRTLAREEREDRRAALIAVHVANFAGRMLPEGKHITVHDLIGGSVTPLESFRRGTDPQSFLDELRSRDPQAEVTMGQAVLDSMAPGAGKWSKLGTREGLMQPLNVALVMAGRKPN